MSDELLKKIYLDCQTLFRHCSVDASNKLMLPIWVGTGWLPLVYDICLELEKLANGLSEKGVPNDSLPRISTIKQKYGQLRCYFLNGTDEMFERIELYRWLAPKICERCGVYGAGACYVDGCYFVLCNECKVIRAKEIKHAFVFWSELD